MKKLKTFPMGSGYTYSAVMVRDEDEERGHHSNPNVISIVVEDLETNQAVATDIFDYSWSPDGFSWGPEDLAKEVAVAMIATMEETKQHTKFKLQDGVRNLLEFVGIHV